MLSRTLLRTQAAVALVALAAGPVLAQADDDAFAKFPPGVTESEYRVRAPGEGEFRGARVQPPSWFVDLPTERRVEVLLYDEGLGAESLTLEGSGATLGGVTRLPNDNYLLAEVLVGENASPGELRFRASGGRSYPWRLERAKRPGTLTPADLVYLIMPDRFANGDTTNDSVEGMTQTGTARDKFLFRHGGDLAGITQRLGYLEGLGVTALWLNPVLENDQPYESYHGYAVTDHYRIDRRLGSLADYQRLVDGAHARGLKVLMDIVPNHVGDEHYLYADMPAADWFHQPEAFVRSNFRIPSVLDPHAAQADRRRMLDGWFDHHMPDLNQGNPHVARYLTQVALWWLGHTGQDGYRVDTYPYSDPDFMADWSEALHAAFPGVSFFGEVWVDGLPNQASFVPGRVGDDEPVAPVRVGANGSVTDFQLKDALLEAMNQSQSWVGGVGKVWLTLTQDYLYDDPNALITFLDNHDLTRLATVVGGDEQRIRSAVTLLLTLRGTPMLTYGTEIAMEGSGGGFGEGGRRDMPGGWTGDAADAFSGRGLSAKQASVQRYVRELATYRKANPGLALGALTHFVPEDGVYVYFRTSPDGQRRWMVAYNGSDAPVRHELARYRGLTAGFVDALPVGGDVAFPVAGALELGAREAVVYELLR